RRRHTRFKCDWSSDVCSSDLNRRKSALLVSHGENRNLELASRNIEGVKLAAPNVLQPYDVLKHDLVLLSKDAAARLNHSLDPERSEERRVGKARRYGGARAAE